MEFGFKYFSPSLVESGWSPVILRLMVFLAGKWRSPGDGQEQPIMVHMCENCNNLLCMLTSKINLKYTWGLLR